MKNRIIDSVGEFYSIIVDETMDIAKLEQISFCIRYCFDDFYLAKIDQFVKYFEETYLQSNIFPTKLWNHYETTGPRTNNHVEGYNDRLKGYCGAATQSCVLKCLINEH